MLGKWSANVAHKLTCVHISGHFLEKLLAFLRNNISKMVKKNPQTSVSHTFPLSERKNYIAPNSAPRSQLSLDAIDNVTDLSPEDFIHRAESRIWSFDDFFVDTPNLSWREVETRMLMQVNIHECRLQDAQ